MTDEQTLALTDLLTQMERGRFSTEGERLALSDAIRELSATREMLDAANSIGFQNDFLTRISPDTWVMHSDDEANNGVQFDSALAAWREGIKGEKQ